MQIDKFTPTNESILYTCHIPIQHILMNTTTEQVKAMESGREIIQSVNFSLEETVHILLSMFHGLQTRSVQCLSQRFLRDYAVA
jgi:hypothetical protein